MCIYIYIYIYIYIHIYTYIYIFTLFVCRSKPGHLQLLSSTAPFYAPRGRHIPAILELEICCSSVMPCHATGTKFCHNYPDFTLLNEQTSSNETPIFPIITHKHKLNIHIHIGLVCIGPIRLVCTPVYYLVYFNIRGLEL